MKFSKTKSFTLIQFHFILKRKERHHHAKSTEEKAAPSQRRVGKQLHPQRERGSPFKGANAQSRVLSLAAWKIQNGAPRVDCHREGWHCQSGRLDGKDTTYDNL